MKHLLALLVLLAGCKSSGSNRSDVERAVGSVTGPRNVSRPRHAGPDPAFVNVAWGPLHLAPGASSRVDLDLVNRGEAPAGPFRVAVYASLGRVVTANRTLVGAADVASLGLSAQHLTVAYTAPATPGTYAVGIEIDDQRQVAGDDRGNNTSAPAQLTVK